MSEYISVTQYALRHQKDGGNIRRLLLNGRMNGIKVGRQWAIKNDEPYPIDERITKGKYVHQRKILKLKRKKDLMKSLTNMSDDLYRLYGKNMTCIMIYGSYARGTEKEDSDVDIAIFINKTDTANTSKMISCVAKYELETGVVLSAIEIENNKYKKWKEIMPFYKNIQKDGITLWKNGQNVIWLVKPFLEEVKKYLIKKNIIVK